MRCCALDVGTLPRSRLLQRVVRGYWAKHERIEELARLYRHLLRRHPRERGEVTAIKLLRQQIAEIVTAARWQARWARVAHEPAAVTLVTVEIREHEPRGLPELRLQLRFHVTRDPEDFRCGQRGVELPTDIGREPFAPERP